MTWKGIPTHIKIDKCDKCSRLCFVVNGCTYRIVHKCHFSTLSSIFKWKE